MREHKAFLDRDREAERLMREGKVDEALERAEAIKEDAADRDFPWFRVRALAVTGVALHRRGALDGAERALREAVSLADEALGPDHRSSVLQRLDFAQILVHAGQTDEAIDVLRRANAAAERLEDEALLAPTLALFGRALDAVGRAAEAEEALGRALDAVTRWRDRVGKDAPAALAMRQATVAAEIAIDLADKPRQGARFAPLALYADAARWLGAASAARSDRFADSLLAAVWLRLAYLHRTEPQAAALFARYALHVLPAEPVVQVGSVGAAAREVLAALGAGAVEAHAPGGVFRVVATKPELVAVAHPREGLFFARRERIAIGGEPAPGDVVTAETGPDGDLVRVVGSAQP